MSREELAGPDDDSDPSNNGLRAGRPATKGPQRTAAQLRAQRWGLVMRLLRKIHLYSGIFMFPWVMIYGVSALLFNHPLLFSDNPVTQSFGPETTSGTALAALPAPDALAKEVVAAMGAAGQTQGKTSDVKLIAPEEAMFARSQATVSTSTADQNYSVALNMDGQGGTVRSRPKEVAPAALPENRPTFATTNLEIETPALAKVRESATAILSKLNVPTSEAMAVTMPDLTFQVEADGKPWNVTYNFERRTATARLADVAASTISTRQYLLRLHLVHGYPETFTAKTLWCIAVDAMFASMVFWGVSGLLMWWQLKATRSLGSVFAVLSVITATVLMIGMHQEFISSPGRGEGGGGGGGGGGGPGGGAGVQGGPGGARPTGTGESLGRERRGRGEGGAEGGRGEGPMGAREGARGEGGMSGDRPRGGRGRRPSEEAAPNTPTTEEPARAPTAALAESAPATPTAEPAAEAKPAEPTPAPATP